MSSCLELILFGGGFVVSALTPARFYYMFGLAGRPYWADAIPLPVQYAARLLGLLVGLGAIVLGATRC